MSMCESPPENIPWRSEKDGSRTCPSCGSLHPADFLDIIWKYTQAEPGYTFSTTTKGWYKFYASRPNVRNAGDGGIKFYGMHIPGAMRDEIEAAVKLAAARQSFEMNQRYGRA